jgi:hypothetical protein
VPPFSLTPTNAAPPPQWLPGFIRWPLRWLLYPFLRFDLAIQAAVRALAPRPLYRLEGQCDASGACCKHILVPTPQWQPLRALALIYLTQVHGFYRSGLSVEAGDDTSVDIYKCRYLKDDNRCAHYTLRPAVCRQWPEGSGRAVPTLLPGCGYRVVRRGLRVLE